MAQVRIEELYKKIGSIYKLVIIASRRTVELAEGASKLVDAPSQEKLGNISLKEILEGKIGYKVGKPERK